MRIWMLMFLAVLAVGCNTAPKQVSTPPPDEPEGPHIDDAKSSRINTQLGIAYLQRGQLQQAMNKLEKAVKQDPNYSDAHAAMAVLYEQMREVDKAEDEHKRAVELAPEDSAIANNYGRFLCNQKRLKDAEKFFNRAADNPLYQTPEVPLTNAGTCLLRADRTEDAETYFLKALKGNPKFAPALIRMAEIRFNKGVPESARAYYQRYLEVAPQTPESLWLGVQIEKALGDKNAVASYSLLLKGKYPDSEETRRLIEQERNAR